MKGPAYFFNLWGRNFIGNFKAIGNLAKKVPLGTLVALVIGLPVMVLSPFTSLIKTVIDYTSRKTEGNPFNLEKNMTKQEKIRAKNTAIDTAIDNIRDADLQAIIKKDLITYKKKSIFSTMSKSTRLMLDTMSKSTRLMLDTMKICDNESISCKYTLKSYMKDPRNADKGFYNLVLKKIFTDNPAPQTHSASANVPSDSKLKPDSNGTTSIARSKNDSSARGKDDSPLLQWSRPITTTNPEVEAHMRNAEYLAARGRKLAEDAQAELQTSNLGLNR